MDVSCPRSQLAVPVYDAGFVQGVTVAEQLRTFGGRLFRLPQHLERLQHSLEIVGVSPAQTVSQLGRRRRGTGGPEPPAARGG